MLEECLTLAEKIAANRPRSSDTYTGGASVSAIYNPYTAEWEVCVSWSCSTKIEYSDISIGRACERVLKDLKRIEYE